MLKDILTLNGNMKFTQGLLSRINGRESIPLEEWLNINKTKLYKIGWVYLHNNFDVEDALQNAMLQVLKNIHQLREMQNFNAWATSIFINECKKILKQRSKNDFIEDISFQEIESWDKQDFILKDELDKLEYMYKQVILLKFICGYTQKEIATILNLPLGTVKVRIYRALNQLRGYISEEGAI